MKILGFATAAVIAVTASTAFAQDFNAEKKARQGQFRIMAFNLGLLGDMLKGEREYDAEMAQAAADNLVTVSNLHEVAMWPEGSDNMSIDGTRAQPNIWEKPDEFAAKWADFGKAAMAMQAAASGGTDAIGPAMGPIGGSCKACHETFRAPEG